MEAQNSFFVQPILPPMLSAPHSIVAETTSTVIIPRKGRAIHLRTVVPSGSQKEEYRLCVSGRRL